MKDNWELNSVTQVLADVTVVIPVKDRLEDLKIAVQSVCEQTILPRELIIVDDFSRVPVQASDFADLGSITLVILRNEPNLGAAASCNRGVREAGWPIVLFLDSDDCFATTYVEEVSGAWHLAKAQTVCIAAGFWWCTNELQPYRTQVVLEHVDRESLLKRGNFVGGNSVLSVRREAYLAVGGCPEVRGSNDLGLLLRLSQAGEIQTLPKPLLFYRSPSTSLLENETRNFRRQVLAMFAIVREQPLADRKLAHQRLLRDVCYILAQAGRTRLCCKLVWSIMRRYRAFRDSIYILAIVMLGNQRYAALLRRFAYFRAGLMARTHPSFFDKA